MEQGVTELKPLRFVGCFDDGMLAESLDAGVEFGTLESRRRDQDRAIEGPAYD